jgi:peptidoglycan LD-endopeptidase LytH
MPVKTAKPKLEPPVGKPPSPYRGALPAVLFLVAIIAAFVILRAPEPSQGSAETAFPLPERYSGSFTNDWGASRAQGRHEGTDVFAPEGTPIYSITDGTVSRALGSSDDGWNDLGGYTVLIEAAYDAGPIEEGDFLYYAHLNAPADLDIGETVEAGQKIGEVGDTGQGPEATRGGFEPHLHLGWYEGGWFWYNRAETASGAMNPYPLLRWIERNDALRSGSRVGYVEERISA